MVELEKHQRENAYITIDRTIYLVVKDNKKDKGKMFNCNKCAMTDNPKGLGCCKLKKYLHLDCKIDFATNYYYKEVGSYLNVWKLKLKGEVKQ